MASVSGFREAKARLIKLGMNLDRVVPLIQEDLGLAQSDMQRVAPVRTGYLRSHIVKNNLPDGAEVHSQAPYSGFLEWGTRFMTPRTFFRPAMYASIDRLRKAISRVVHE